jgi:hypothetical protein
LFQWGVSGVVVDFLRVRNFETFQHYSKRRPPWVKLYKDLWHDPEFIHLDSVVKLCIIGCFTLASETDNRIPENRKWIQKRLGLVRPPDIAALLASGFIERIPRDGTKTVQGSSKVATGLLQGSSRVATKTAQGGDDSKDVTGKSAINVLAQSRDREEKSKNNNTQHTVPSDFVLPAGELADLKVNQPEVDWDFQLERFKLHWFPSPDPRGDWLIEWRRWVLNARPAIPKRDRGGQGANGDGKGNGNRDSEIHVGESAAKPKEDDPRTWPDWKWQLFEQVNGPEATEALRAEVFGSGEHRSG